MEILEIKDYTFDPKTKRPSGIEVILSTGDKVFCTKSQIIDGIEDNSIIFNKSARFATNLMKEIVPDNLFRKVCDYHKNSRSDKEKFVDFIKCLPDSSIKQCKSSEDLVELVERLL